MKKQLVFYLLCLALLLWAPACIMKKSQDPKPIAEREGGQVYTRTLPADEPETPAMQSHAPQRASQRTAQPAAPAPARQPAPAASPPSASSQSPSQAMHNTLAMAVGGNLSIQEVSARVLSGSPKSVRLEVTVKNRTSQDLAANVAFKISRGPVSSLVFCKNVAFSAGKKTGFDVHMPFDPRLFGKGTVVSATLEGSQLQNLGQKTGKVNI